MTIAKQISGNMIQIESGAGEKVILVMINKKAMKDMLQYLDTLCENVAVVKNYK